MIDISYHAFFTTFVCKYNGIDAVVSHVYKEWIIVTNPTPFVKFSISIQCET